MKKVLLIAVAIVATGCSKKDEGGYPNIDSKLLIGKWEATESYKFDNDRVLETEPYDVFEKGDYTMEFTNDKVSIYQKDYYEKYVETSYKIENFEYEGFKTKLLTIDGDTRTFFINKLTTNEMYLEMGIKGGKRIIFKKIK